MEVAILKLNDIDIKRNGSGYYDPTAYKAIKNMEVINMQKVDFRAGEIWEVSIDTNSASFPLLVLACGDGIVTGLRLVKDESQRNDITLHCGKYGLMHTCSKMVQYTFSTNLHDFIRCLRDDELADVREKVAINFGIARVVPTKKGNDSETITKLKYELDGYKYLYEKALADVVRLSAKVNDNED